jgi:hypothetical protein
VRADEHAAFARPLPEGTGASIAVAGVGYNTGEPPESLSLAMQPTVSAGKTTGLQENDVRARIA